MLSHILSSTDKEKIMKEVIRMSKDFINIHEWEKEKCDELVRLESKRVDHEEGFTEGVEQGIEQGIDQATMNIIISMLENNTDLEFISKVTNKSIDEIMEIKKQIK